ncbi:hypothetical protein M378DRAFT_18056 [Amanita muscaria Koide BX008]|uniref:Uncharacterized protein n=1 Tax=Amanita muscaria (strain Koide BX008) TaxID=946122 RepID=A0A0C2WGS2_AMAMK|nr:hypothetical protein M378DRAFT_18056 [Amanita muscaria Koide BX008]
MSSSSSTETPSPLISEPPSMNRGNAQSRGGGGGNPDFPISSTNAHRIAKGHRDPSMSTAQRASNASNQIPPTQNPTGGGAHFQNAQFTGGGHAFGANSIVNNILSGDGQFTEDQRNLVRRGYTSQSNANPMCVDM